ncbi:hypothetical protein PHLGIDRAFT_128721 [Phlebiopsis gigantea 11061_1 CR5-6]|uniref:Vacuolar protein-sorting-associated protein 36 n=1 Tax=Phlebiopsis gigantea (strain 11061_1 CR5-6) TaxID=745531 RepID=A0A0C3RW40_PHLG1|nr:hypothetical protein PHLGIDRAFT_128721 [Phlebiopsis gigantea 11061_1 CR5-6]
MGALKRYTTSVDGTIPVPALLYQDEEVIASQEGVGIYDGAQKSARHQTGAVHVSTHRLFYIDASHPRSRSFALDLSHVEQTDYWAGLLRSSAKVTLYLNALPRLATPGPTQGASTNTRQNPDSAFDVWECAVCSYRNPPGLSPSASMVCGLCGVPRAAMPTASVAVPAPPRARLEPPLSSSLPPASSAHRSPRAASDPPSRVETPAGHACPACTFLNHPSLPACEICGTPLPRPAAKSAPASRPTSDDEDEGSGGEAPRMIKVSFRKGGDKAFYAGLRQSLLDKAWEGPKLRRALASTSQDPSRAATPTTASRTGIHGILQDVQTTAAATQTNMEDALQDLETLQVQAREMVRYAAELNERLTALSAPSAPAAAVEPEEAAFIRSSLAQLGLQMANAPVTLDMARDERRWHEELARELAGVWGGWNRARGVALIPPATFLLVLPHLPSCTEPPVSRRTFASGLAVLHTPPYSRAAFSARLVGLLSLGTCSSLFFLAHEEQLPLGLVQDMVGEAEDAGDVCRDEAEGRVGAGARAQEVRWWANVFLGYVWDGQAD